jgi:hypothetical protein
MPSPIGAPLTRARGAAPPAGAAPAAGLPGCVPIPLLLLTPAVSRVIPNTNHIGDLHDASAKERNTNHEHPARNDTESPEEISNWNSKAVLGKEAIEWVE